MSAPPDEPPPGECAAGPAPTILRALAALNARDAEITRAGDATRQRREAEFTREVAVLAALSPAAYEVIRKQTADRLDVRLGALDKLVEAARDQPGRAAPDTAGRGRPLEIADIEPWPEPLSGADVFGEISATIRRHVVLDGAAADALALWVMHTHAIDAAYVTPRLAITSPEKRCGKTTLLTLLSRIVSRPLSAANMTTATLFRVIGAAHPTLLVDEADSFLGENGEMRGIINAGHY
jgi:hypothetical protein